MSNPIAFGHCFRGNPSPKGTSLPLTAKHLWAAFGTFKRGVLNIQTFSSIILALDAFRFFCLRDPLDRRKEAPMGKYE
jgi:hypothetical protein